MSKFVSLDGNYYNLAHIPHIQVRKDNSGKLVAVHVYLLGMMGDGRAKEIVFDGAKAEQVLGVLLNTIDKF